jgi:hypothetical protein
MTQCNLISKCQRFGRASCPSACQKRQHFVSQSHVRPPTRRTQEAVSSDFWLAEVAVSPGHSCYGGWGIRYRWRCGARCPWTAYENRYVSLVETSTNRHNRMLLCIAKVTNQSSRTDETTIWWAGDRMPGHVTTNTLPFAVQCPQLASWRFLDTFRIAYQIARLQNRVTPPS